MHLLRLRFDFFVLVSIEPFLLITLINLLLFNLIIRHLLHQRLLLNLLHLLVFFSHCNIRGRSGVSLNGQVKFKDVPEDLEVGKFAAGRGRDRLGPVPGDCIVEIFDDAASIVLEVQLQHLGANDAH